MSVYDMFTVPLVHYRIADWQHNKQRILNALPELNEEHLKSNGDVYTDFFDWYAEPDLPPYADTVIDIIKPYLADFTDQRRVEFTDMWFQSSFNGNGHSLHNHGHSGWSSVIYVEFNPKVHTPTRFISPFNNFWNGNLEDYMPEVQEGDMVIFPSTIAHEAEVNKSNVKRTIVSYNLRGKVDKVKRSMWQGDPVVYR